VSARKSRYESERAYWRRFQCACKNNDVPKTYSSLLAWLHRAEPGMTVDRFQSSAADPSLDQELSALSSALFADKPGPLGAAPISNPPLLKHATPPNNFARKNILCRP
jgi:hypothetical protein